MSFSYAGKLALSAIMPSSAAAVLAAANALTGAATRVADDLAGATACSASAIITPPNLAASVTAVSGILAAMAQGLAFSTPSATFQLGVTNTLIATLTPIVADLSASLALVTPLVALLAESNVQAWSWYGTGGALGGAVQAAIGRGLPDGSPVGISCAGFMLASTGGATWSGLQTFFPPIPGTQQFSTLQYLGGLSIDVLMGLLSVPTRASKVTLAAQLTSLGARLDGATRLAAALTLNPPSLLNSISLANGLLASLQNTSLRFVAATDALAILAQLVSDLTALAAAIAALIAALNNVTSALATAGVLAFVYEGKASELGAAIAAAINGGWPDGTLASAPSNALVMLASGGGTGTALHSLFGGI